MTRWIVGLLLLLSTWTAQAHQPDISSTVLMERNNGQWILQVSGALTAFEYAVKKNFPEQDYKSPEEFEEMVVDHLEKNISVSFNGGEVIALKNVQVRLGHETNVYFELTDVPKTIYSASIKNESFKDIHRNQSALIIVKDGFSQEQFVLNNGNDHSIAMVANGTKFELDKGSGVVRSVMNISIFSTLLLITMVALFMLYGRMKNDHKRKAVALSVVR